MGDVLGVRERQAALRRAGADDVGALGLRSRRPGCAALAALVLAALVVRIAPAAGEPPPSVPSSRAGATLWLLAVGVSDYRDPTLNLAFADADARAIAAALREQDGRRIYSRVEARVLVNADVRRESILAGIRDLIATAGPDDVATIFMAGHGVRDLLTGTYYFLPHDATHEDFFTRGLRVEELNDMVRILQRHVRHVVVILDTCHSGAAELGGSSMARADDFTARVRADGLFLLAATRPGDKSKEISRLGHGVFTYVLLNALRGEAPAGVDGLLSLAELVIYLGTEVPRLTRGEQTPYYLIAGSDLLFADVREPNSIVVLPFRNQDAHARENDWVALSLQEAFQSALGRTPVLNVCPLPSEDGSDEPLRAWAQRLGCGQFVTGSFVVDGAEVELHARVTDAASGSDEVRSTVRGRRADFARLRDELVKDVIGRIPTVRAYRRMLEAQGIASPEDESPRRAPAERPPPPPEPRSHWFPRFELVRRAVAQETARLRTPAPPQDTIRQLIEEYRRAHEAKQIDRVARLWDGFSSKQHAAMRRYLDQAGDLTLELADTVIEPHDDEATVAFTRVERFVDRESGKPVRIEVRQRMILVRRDGEWKIARIEAR